MENEITKDFNEQKIQELNKGIEIDQNNLESIQEEFRGGNNNEEEN